MDRISAFDTVNEPRLEWSKASWSTKIVDKRGVIQIVRSAFYDVMKIWWPLEDIQVFDSKGEWRFSMMEVKNLRKMIDPMTIEGKELVVW